MFLSLKGAHMEEEKPNRFRECTNLPKSLEYRLDNRYAKILSDNRC